MKNEKGFSLIEVIIAVALLGIIGIALLSGLATASRALFIADERATAESLARSQMEYVKNQPYAASYTPDSVPAEYAGYLATINTEPIESSPGGSLQRIRVTISHNGTPIITAGDYTLEGYKVER